VSQIIIPPGVQSVTPTPTVTPAEGLANTTAQPVVNQDHIFNGTTWDRLHGNWRTTTGDTGAKTTTFNGATQTNYDSVGAFITVRLGTVSGTTPTLTIAFQFSPDNGTTWHGLGPNLSNLTSSNQTAGLLIGPTNWSQTAGATPANLATATMTSITVWNMFLPRVWRLTYTIAGTTPSFTITAVDVNYIGGA